MNGTKRTDLAIEAVEIFEESAEETTKLSGVAARSYRRGGLFVERVDILDEDGAKALGKDVGRYVTVTLGRGGDFRRRACCIGQELRRLLPVPLPAGPILVVGLGNREITPDALGPQVVENILVTRHLKLAQPRLFAQFAPVCALSAGVLGTSGMESAEQVAAVVEKLSPACVIAVDALMSRRMQRLCNSVQLSDTGLAPGAGIGNCRQALTRETLGVPVLSVGVPTVIDGPTLAGDLLEEAGVEQGKDLLRSLPPLGMIVTPKDIDARIGEVSRLVACGVDLALHPKLTVDDVLALRG